MLSAVASTLVLNVAAAPTVRPAAPSQVLVLGMHHSGTSLVSNLTMMLGAYGGELDELLLHPENPLKFWERRDVVALDEQRLTAGMQADVASRYDVPEWVAYGFNGAKDVKRISSSEEARAVVTKLNHKRPWVTKDPRMCLVAEEWMQLLDAPVCVIVHREPLSVANSMMIYSHNVSLAEWASVYENYYQSTLRACSGKPTVVVQHAELTAHPWETTQKLYRDLVAAGVEGLALPTEARIASLIRPSAKTEPIYLSSERKIIGEKVHKISQALATASLPATVEPATWLVSTRRNKEAFATLLTTANADYLRGALVLGSSIRSFDSTRDMVCLVTPAVPKEWRGSLTVAGWTVVEVAEISEFWWGKSDECSKFGSDQGERWGHMATKLRLWQLTQYSRVMYLDADTILTGPVDEIVSTVTTFAAEKPKYHSHFNAGVLLLTPSQTVFDELLALGGQQHTTIFGNVIDCTEQGLLNAYFNNAPGREVTKLDVGRADVIADWTSPDAKTPFAVHWITHVCPKPWFVADGSEEMQPHCDPVMYTYWARIWNRLTAVAKDESSHITFGSRAAARRTMRRLTGVSAGPSDASVKRSVGGGSYGTVGEMLTGVRDSVGRQLRQLTDRRELRRRKRYAYEYDAPWSEGTWAWIAIIGTLALGLAAGALLHKLFIKAPTEVGKGMTVVQAKRMGFQALGEGKGHQGVVSAVDDDDDDDDDEEEEVAPPPKSSKK